MVWRLQGRRLRLLDALTGHVIMTLPDLTTGEPFGAFQRVFYPSMSCSGRVAAVQHTGSGATLDIFTRTIVTVRGVAHVRTVERVEASSPLGLRDPAWAPDGRSLLFDQQDSSGATSLWTVRADGGGLHLLEMSGNHYSGAQWSPDGRRIVFIRSSGGYAEQQVVS